MSEELWFGKAGASSEACFDEAKRGQSTTGRSNDVGFNNFQTSVVALLGSGCAGQDNPLFGSQVSVEDETRKRAYIRPGSAEALPSKIRCLSELQTVHSFTAHLRIGQYLPR